MLTLHLWLKLLLWLVTSAKQQNKIPFNEFFTLFHIINMILTLEIGKEKKVTTLKCVLLMSVGLAKQSIHHLMQLVLCISIYYVYTNCIQLLLRRINISRLGDAPARFVCQLLTRSWRAGSLTRNFPLPISLQVHKSTNPVSAYALAQSKPQKYNGNVCFRTWMSSLCLFRER